MLDTMTMLTKDMPCTTMQFNLFFLNKIVDFIAQL